LRLRGERLGRTDPRPLVGLHASGGREIKQWQPARFGQAAGRVAQQIDARVVLTGAPGDRTLVEAARAALPPSVDVVDLADGVDLMTLAAVLQQLTIYVTGDTGPMHLAAAMGTPVVAVFGLSDPRRYAPLSPHRRIVRIDLPCSPCNRVRLPPARCQGHVPDCLEGIEAEMVYRAALDLLAEVGRAVPPVPADRDPAQRARA
jgi:ADP-heptose:LPS heptosyltransferase